MKFDRIIIRPYSSECGGARDIVKILTEQGIPSKRVYSKLENYEPQPGDFILNWGASYPPDWSHLLTKKNAFLNHWNSVGNSVSKIRSFHNFKKAKVPTPDWTQSHEEAMRWIKDGWVCVRQTERGYDGKGLILAKKASDVEYAPLYTKFMPDTINEYRAYIFKGEMIDLLYKYAPEGAKHPLIRTETNGWEYGRSSMTGKLAKEIGVIAAAAIAANDMDFGGVDIMHGNYGLVVLETNSEPGIGKITAQRFANAIRKEAGL